jgi:hypothetical protein
MNAALERPHNLKAVARVLNALYYAPQPNCRFNADANMGHAFGILMAHVGTLRTSCSGAG